MDKLLTRLALGLGLAALIVVFVQNSTISDLERRLDALTDATPVSAPAETAVPTAAYDDSLLDKRVAALEKQLAERRVISKAVERAAVSRRPRAAQPSTAEASTADEVTSLREDVDALLTGAGVSSDEGKKQIADLVTKIRTQERKERQARWAEFRQKRDEEFIKNFAEEAGLDEDTTASVTTIVGEFRSAQMKLRIQARDGTLSFEEMRTKRRALRGEANTKLGEVLTAEQLEDFKTKMNEGRRRGGRRGGL